MKPFISPPKPRLLTGLRLLASIALAAATAGCGNKYVDLTPTVQAQMMNDLQAGKLTLDCGAGCMLSWIGKVDSIQALDAAERWPELAQSVMRIGYGQDLAYYYLGQAAQGLGYHPAAIAYYKWAFALNTGQNRMMQCAAQTIQTHDACEGVNLADSIPVLIKASNDVMAQRAMQQQQQQQQVDAAAEPPERPRVRRHRSRPAATGSTGATTPARAAQAPQVAPGANDGGWSLPPPATDQ